MLTVCANPPILLRSSLLSGLSVWAELSPDCTLWVVHLCEVFVFAEHVIFSTLCTVISMFFAYVNPQSVQINQSLLHIMYMLKCVLTVEVWKSPQWKALQWVLCAQHRFSGTAQYLRFTGGWGGPHNICVSYHLDYSILCTVTYAQYLWLTCQIFASRITCIVFCECKSWAHFPKMVD